MSRTHTHQSPALRKGLIRLLRAVMWPSLKVQHPEAVARRLLMCAPWKQGETPEMVLARHPELAPDARTLRRRMGELREHLPGLAPRQHIPPWRLAQEYRAAYVLPHD